MNNSENIIQLLYSKNVHFFTSLPVNMHLWVHVQKNKNLIVERWLIEVEPQNFEAEVLKCPKLAIVAFLKKGIASGDILISVFRRITLESGPKMDIAFFKADVENCSDIASKYRISKIPTTLIFIKGRVEAHFIGVLSAQKVIGIIEALA